MVEDHEFDNVYGLLDGFKYVYRDTKVWDQISSMEVGDEVIFSGKELEFSGNPFSEKLSVCKPRWNIHYTDIQKP